MTTPQKAIGKLIKGIYLATPPTLTDGQESPVLLDQNGKVVTTPTGGSSKTYMVSFRGISAPGGQFFELVGVNAVVGRIVEIYIYKPSVNVEFRVRKQSVASTGGTAPANAAVPNDSNDGAASLTYKTYTVAPTPGTSVGIYIDVKNVTAGDIVAWTFGDNPTLVDKPLVVRNGESIAFETDVAATVYGYAKVTEATS